MKNNYFRPGSLFGIIICSLLPLLSFGQFKAEMHNIQPGGQRTYLVTHSGTLYRYDLTEENEKMVVIVNPDLKQSSILIPSMQFVHHMDIQSMQSISNDPVQAFIYYMENYDTSEGEFETINGYKTTPIEISYGEQKLFTCWFSEDLNFPVKIKNEQQEGHYMELKNITVEEIDPSAFEIPEFYTEVDDQMRPLIPEPPPPESWTEIKEKVPFAKSFKRGDKVRFMVETDIYHKLILENNGEEPSKIIRYQIRNGEVLPESEQGPADYRTNRLFKGERKTNTLAWKTGIEIVLEIHEGEMKVEVKPER